MKVPCLFILVHLFHLFNISRTMKIKNEGDAMLYLVNYGYMDDTGSGEKLANASAMKIFQKFTGLPETGVFDEETLHKMQMPRCANKERMDIYKNADITMLDTKAGWRLSEIREFHYRIRNFPKSGIRPEIVREQVRKAFDFWEDVANINCIEIEATDPSSTAEIIEISFETADHGDSINFGARGMGEAVAHAFFLSDDINHKLEGDIHFYNERGWTVDTKDDLITGNVK